ncbi:MAG: hydroxyacid dehydrogenase [Chloroflexota bacterium]
MTKKFKALVTQDSVHTAGIDLLREVADVTVLPEDVGQAEVIKAVADADGILARMPPITREVVEVAPNLKIVARHGVGYDNVDLDACTDHNVVVTITANANAISVSEYALACMLNVSRKVAQSDKAIKAGIWDRKQAVGGELLGKTLGIIGFGRVGSRLAKLVSGFDLQVLTCDPYISPDVVEGRATLVDLNTLLQESDFVTVHVPLNEETRYLIDAAALAQMKESAILINTARGGIVNEVELYEALTSGQIAAAAIDVFEQEPLPPSYPLVQLDNILCSPHAAGQSTEALVRMSVDAAQSILQVFRGELPDAVVNTAVLNKVTLKAN